MSGHAEEGGKAWGNRLSRGAVGLFLVLLAGLVQGSVVGEQVFADAGFVDFVVEGAQEKGCTTYRFVSLGVESGEYVFASFHVHPSPQLAAFTATVSLNGAFVDALDEGGVVGEWLRVELPAAELREKNALELCVQNSFAVTRFRVSPDSRVGVYRLPRLENFWKEPATREPSLNEVFLVTVGVENHGGEDAVIALRYRRPRLDEKLPDVQVLKGATELERVTVPSCAAFEGRACTSPGKASFAYDVKAVSPIQMTLLPAVLSYENVFGEPVEMESNRPTIRVQAVPSLLEPLMLAEKEILAPGETFQGKIAVKNNGLETVYNARVRVRGQNELFLGGDTEVVLPSLEPGKTAFVEVRVRSDEPGEYWLGCETVYDDGRLRRAECQAITLKVLVPAVDPLMLVAGVLVLLAGGAYWFIVRG